MFGFGGVFGRKPRQFDYRPLYYDPQVEKRNQRRQELLGYSTLEEKEASKNEEYVPGKYIRRDMIYRRGYGRNESTRGSKTSLTRTVIIFVLLLLAAWWLMGTDTVDTFFKGWLAK